MFQCRWDGAIKHSTYD